MRKLFILLIAIPYFLTAQVKNPATPKSQSPNSRFANTQANSNKIASTDFEYDAAGNVTKDLTQGISNIDYVSLSRMEPDPYVGGMTSTSFRLPRQIAFVDGRKIKNQYTATGKKLVTQLLINDVISVEYSYVGNLTYIRTPGKDWKLIEMKIDEGRLVPKSETSTEMVYEYDIEDQTGSPRVSFRENTTTGQAEIVRKQDFDPFGLPLKGIDYQSPSIDTLSKKYFFNGKEYLVTFGLKMYDYGMRTYNPRLGRYYQIDPKASMMPSWSPYSFSFDNPIRYRDYDGQIPYPITVRSFAPFPTFGGGFRGDNRGYSLSSNVSSKVTQNIAFDTDKKYLSTGTWSDISYHPLLGEARAHPSGGINSFSRTELASGATRSDFSTSYAGANPLTPEGTPNINVESLFSITSSKNTLSVKGVLSGDNFPSTEAFIKDPSGNSVFLGIGFYEGGPFTSLPGEKNNRAITDFNVTIQLDKKGNFSGIQYNGSNYTIGEWNKRFEQADPNKK